MIFLDLCQVSSLTSIGKRKRRLWALEMKWMEIHGFLLIFIPQEISERRRKKDRLFKISVWAIGQSQGSCQSQDQFGLIINEGQLANESSGNGHIIPVHPSGARENKLTGPKYG
jgi:hypothetical protein